MGLTGAAQLAYALGAVALLLLVVFLGLLGRDIAALARLFRALRAERMEIPPAVPLVMPGMRALGREAIRLLRTERRRRARLEASAAADRALLEGLPDPLFRLDADGHIAWRNASATAVFGTQTAALLRHPDLRGAIAGAVSAGAPVRRHVSLPVPVPRELETTVVPVDGPLYLLLTDRTRERSLERMRADFVANASHELRTPLASLIGFIETLRGPAADDPEAQVRFLGIMAEQAERMQRVIADLLSLSRIEINEHRAPEEVIDVGALVGRVAAGLEPVLAKAGATLDVSVAGGLPRVAADADQLAQVFTNLIDNAIKYGRKAGTIRFDAAAAEDGVCVSVADDGPGIAREHLPRLTERFYRVDKGRSRAVGGTGLGLAIVKHVVNRHRGRLSIESAEGKGTAVSVWLPGREKRDG